MEVYIIKYALTKGIVKAEIADEKGDITENDMISIISSNTPLPEYCFHKGQWTFTHSAAVKKATDMKTKKIVSLKKQTQKLEDMTF